MKRYFLYLPLLLFMGMVFSSFNNKGITYKKITKTTENRYFNPKQYYQKQCAFCHNETGKIGPPMSTVKAAYIKKYPQKDVFVKKIAAFVLSPNADNRLIKHNKGIYGVMPKGMFSDRDKVERVAEYIYSHIKVKKRQSQREIKSKTDKHENKTITVKLSLSKGTDIGKYLHINKIDFEYASTEITSEMKKELDKVYSFLKSNPEINILIINHTDARGSVNRNLELSKQRAKIIKDYLILKGIPPTRLLTKGAGEAQLLNHCHDGVKCSETEHRKNRRTEFIIL